MKNLFHILTGLFSPKLFSDFPFSVVQQFPLCLGLSPSVPLMPYPETQRLSSGSRTLGTLLEE